MASSSNDSKSKDMLDVFRMFDINNDGHISAVELGRLLRAFGHNPSEDELKVRCGDFLNFFITDLNENIRVYIEI